MNERNKDPGFIGLVPVGRNFVYKDYTPFGIEDMGESGKRMLSIVLLNSIFKKKKDLYHFERKFSPPDPTKKRNVYLIGDCQKYVIDRDRIYLGDTKRGFFLVVFNAKGKKLYEINKRTNARKIHENNH